VEPNDESLVLACRRGEAAAWEALVARYQRLVYSIPRRSGLDEDRSADVFQHVFVTLVEQIGRIEQPDRIGAWLATTARRETWRVSKRERSALSRSETADDDGHDDIPDRDVLPDEALVQLEEQHAVRLAVDSLDDRCRQLLSLLFYEADPPPYAAIAARLDTSEGSIGPTRARCLQKLRRLLEDRGF